MAPGVGLYLDELFFDNYNKNQEKTLNLQVEKLNCKNNMKTDEVIKEMKTKETDAMKEGVKTNVEKDVEVLSDAQVSSGQREVVVEVELETDVEAKDNYEESMKRKQIEVTLCPPSLNPHLLSILPVATSDGTDDQVQNEAEADVEAEVDNEPVRFFSSIWNSLIFGKSIFDS